MKYVCTVAGRSADGAGAWLLLHDWEADLRRLKKDDAFRKCTLMNKNLLTVRQTDSTMLNFTFFMVSPLIYRSFKCE